MKYILAHFNYIIRLMHKLIHLLVSILWGKCFVILITSDIYLLQCQECNNLNKMCYTPDIVRTTVLPYIVGWAWNCQYMFIMPSFDVYNYWYQTYWLIFCFNKTCCSHCEHNRAFCVENPIFPHFTCFKYNKNAFSTITYILM